MMYSVLLCICSGTAIEVKERKKIWDAKRNEKKRIERAIRQKIKEEAKNIAAFSAKSRNSKHSAKAYVSYKLFSK